MSDFLYYFFLATYALLLLAGGVLVYKFIISYKHWHRP